MTTKKKVLVVDDETELVLLYIEMLSGLFIDLATYTDARLALSVVEKESFDLAILDMSMPGLCGTELAEKVLEKNPKCHIVFVTGYDPRELEHHNERQKVKKEFCSMIFTKPFKQDGFVEFVRLSLFPE